jgi:hypothetical protein
VVAQSETLMMPLPHRAAAPAGPLFLNRGYHAVRRSGIAERDQHLIDHDVVQDSVPGSRQTFRESPCMAAASFDQFCHSIAS